MTDLTPVQRQLVTDLLAKAQAVIDSIDPEAIQESCPVDEDTQYSVNANAIWDLGTAIAVTERELGISEADEVEPEADSIKFNLVDVVTDGSAKTFIYEEKTND